VRQSLLQAAKTKIRQIQAELGYVNADEIFQLANTALSKWIKAPFVPAAESQTTLDRFFSA
jgi:hypothetical protein